MFHRSYMHRSILGPSILAFMAGAAAWAIFGKGIKATLKNSDYKDLKRQIYKKSSEISELTREKYEDLVDEVSRNYAKLRGISENELYDLVEDLKTHWWRIKNAWKEGGDIS